MKLNYTEINKNLYSKYVKVNYEIYQTEEPTEEPTELFTTYKPIYKQTYKPISQTKIANYSCTCNIDINENENILIITTSITSALSFIMFLLIWYKYFYKKRASTYIYNNETTPNFGIEYNQT
jgi:hypothetical protein